jgi:Mn-dependent DtxR family transcriptional regulator
MDDYIKEAFIKVKKDIEFLNNELLDMKLVIQNINISIKNLSINLKKEDLISRQTIPQIDTANNVISTYNPTVKDRLKDLKALNLKISTRNRGVSTDRQTDRQTTEIIDHNIQKDIDCNIKEANNILDSLDSLRKEIRLKFKRLTNQEMAVFSVIYQLEEQENREITYNLISKTLNLSESSIRDYIQRIINKGISIKKEKINNKKLILSIPPNLKKIVSLPTIIQLREL